MNIKDAAAALGKRGGSVTSPRKKLSSAENGKKGGRPLARYTCPACKGRATKLVNISQGSIQCQQCDHVWYPDTS